jgi:hypothetical protein
MHLFILLIPGRLVFLLHGDALGSHFPEGVGGSRVSCVAGYRACDALAGFQIVGQVFA